MGRLERSWELIGICWSLLRSDRKFLVFPALATLAVLCITVLIMLPLIANIWADHLWRSATGGYSCDGLAGLEEEWPRERNPGGPLVFTGGGFRLTSGEHKYYEYVSWEKFDQWKAAACQRGMAAPVNSLAGEGFYRVVVAHPWGFLFLYALILQTIFVSANAALTGMVLTRLRGGEPTLRDGWRVVLTRFPDIFGYALIAATVGTLLAMLQRLARGRNTSFVVAIVALIVHAAIDIAWHLLTFMAVPALVAEECGPVEAIERSGQLFREVWGEQMSGNFSLGLVIILVTLLLMLPVSLLLALLSNWLDVGSFSLIVAVLAGMAIALTAVFGGAFSSIWKTALYLYATEWKRETMAPFSPWQLEGAFVVKP